METETNETARKISITLTEDEARAMRGELGLCLRAAPEHYNMEFPRVAELRESLDGGIKALNRPTDCCGKVFRPPHPGCACVLAKAKAVAWDKAGVALTTVQKVSAEHNRKVLEQRVRHAMECAKAHQDRLNHIAAYERTLETDNDEEGIR